MDIKETINKLVQFHKTRNPFEIIKGMNVIVLSVPLHGVRGFYQYFQRNNIIYIEESLKDQDKKFVLAHELGHMLLHKDSNAIFMDTHTNFNTDRYEIEANKFAMELLVDDEYLLEHQHNTKEELSKRLGYDKQLIDLKIGG